MYLGVFSHAEHVFEDCVSVLLHVDAQETISSRIIVYSSVLTVPGGAEHVFEEYFDIPRHADAQETILLQTIVCSPVLTVPGGFVTR